MFYDGSVVGDGRVIRDFLVIFGAPSTLPNSTRASEHGENPSNLVAFLQVLWNIRQ